MSTTIRGFFRPALNLITLAMVAALLTFTGAAASPQPQGSAPAHTQQVVTPKIELAASRLARRGARVVHVAASQAGDPYRWGAMGPNAFDCSGLTSYVYRKATGKRLPHSSSMQRGVTKRISARAARPGDLVFFHGSSGVYHVGIYAGHRMIWHSPQPGSRVHKARIWTRSVSYGRVR